MNKLDQTYRTLYQEAFNLCNKTTNIPPRISIRQALDYDVRGHWLSSWVGFEWGRGLLGRYLAWKVTRKYKRYTWSKNMQLKLTLKQQLNN